MICWRRLDEVLKDRDHCLEIGHRASTAVAGGECGPEVVLADRGRPDCPCRSRQPPPAPRSQHRGPLGTQSGNDGRAGRFRGCVRYSARSRPSDGPVLSASLRAVIAASRSALAPVRVYRSCRLFPRFVSRLGRPGHPPARSRSHSLRPGSRHRGPRVRRSAHIARAGQSRARRGGRDVREHPPGWSRPPHRTSRSPRRDRRCPAAVIAPSESKTHLLSLAGLSGSSATVASTASW